MRARIGDLAIIRFDPISKMTGKKWQEKVGIVTSCISGSKNVPREYGFMYWNTNGGIIEIHYSSLPPGRLIRARPRGGYWVGDLRNIRRDNVEPIE